MLGTVLLYRHNLHSSDFHDSILSVLSPLSGQVSCPNRRLGEFTLRKTWMINFSPSFTESAGSETQILPPLTPTSQVFFFFFFFFFFFKKKKKAAEI